MATLGGGVVARVVFRRPWTVFAKSGDALYTRTLLEQLVALDRVVKQQPLLENDFSC